MASADLRIIRRPTYRGFELTGWQVAVAWAFIFLAATFDTGFAWQYRAGIPEWELNPVACWCFRWFGAGGVVGLKVLTHAFAFSVIGYSGLYGPRGLFARATLAVLAVYAVLSTHYLLGMANLW